MPDYYAHSKNQNQVRQGLLEHLRAVADAACSFAAPFSATELAYYAGIWHDIGKFHPDFQAYLLRAEAEPEKKQRGPDHKAAGVRLALEQRVDPLMLALQGHHGGLHNLTDMKRWFNEKRGATEEAIAVARMLIPDLVPRTLLGFPPYTKNERSTEFFLRMLFSTLVDADFLDTENHFAVEAAAQRGTDSSIDELWRRFEANQELRLRTAEDTPVNRIRAEIYRACLDAAVLPPGFFRLPVPTGGGKTISGMAFGLRHAQLHGLQRIIVAVPYLTITQQTTGVYRGIFDGADDLHSPVLEHHSAAGESKADEDEYDTGEIWRRLAAENWDAPIIVTTTVQLFESMFANSTSRCRKLHRLAGSVIVLDEAQTLPIHLLDPILDGLQELCTNYGASVVLSTATQPAYEAVPIFNRVQAREIVPDPARYFAALKRVNYDWRLDAPLSWSAVAEMLRAETQVLCVVNTKQSALDLLTALDDPNALHLSTLLCGAHRTQVIAEVKRRLRAGEPCRLVTTQVVEAGVDLDFPVVMRALAPLDSIIQAAGRANREGRLERGRVIVFQPEEGKLPGKDYERATIITRKVLGMGFTDLDDPAVTREYFAQLYAVNETDRKQVQDARKGLDYPETAKRFRMIEDDTLSVVAPFGNEDDRTQVEALWQAVEGRWGNMRQVMRQLQPYTVSVYRYQAQKYEQKGWIQMSAVLPDLGYWLGRYDSVCGLVAGDMRADNLIF
ncbi:MAG: CRISPR-associated endonuclease Cas3'' [Anaerolinea sp.]|nr:CRISPR-associated endonuclease Cas3'' [Anaerolinea sp.]